MAEEARERCRAAKGGSLRLEADEAKTPPPELDEEQVADYGAD